MHRWHGDVGLQHRRTVEVQHSSQPLLHFGGSSACLVLVGGLHRTGRAHLPGTLAGSKPPEGIDQRLEAGRRLIVHVVEHRDAASRLSRMKVQAMSGRPSTAATSATTGLDCQAHSTRTVTAHASQGHNLALAEARFNCESSSLGELTISCSTRRPVTSSRAPPRQAATVAAAEGKVGAVSVERLPQRAAGSPGRRSRPRSSERRCRADQSPRESQARQPTSQFHSWKG